MLYQGWEWQWRHVHRRLQAVKDVYAGGPGGTDVAVDVVLSFFQAVHHLKDWIGNDSATTLTREDGDVLIGEHQALQICADVANGSKHAVLTERFSPRTNDADTGVVGNDVWVQVGTGLSAHRFRIRSADKEHDVLDLAEKAVAVWNNFLAGKGLL
ncbi:hypothetical protein P1P68_06090 [Streptomyces scabiei]|uniref:hypothetical protein n=1 Tax=Streptomyces scabiei TaxID=1930 RepID=UPI0029902AB1|nr:hypothetical protein [Streptomyces scabiei]MDW8804373.1 hypothetical protein [Streptomyces scabiei]